MSRQPTLRTILFLTLLACATLLAGCGALDGQTVRNVAEYQIRKTLPPLLVYRTPPAPASLSGLVQDEAGQPIADALGAGLDRARRSGPHPQRPEWPIPSDRDRAGPGDADGRRLGLRRRGRAGGAPQPRPAA
ncbi:MAG: hypothetical protein V9H69_03570 [Anaerolineae bacterium]